MGRQLANNTNSPLGNLTEAPMLQHLRPIAPATSENTVQNSSLTTPQISQLQVQICSATDIINLQQVASFANLIPQPPTAVTLQQ